MIGQFPSTKPMWLDGGVVDVSETATNDEIDRWLTVLTRDVLNYIVNTEMSRRIAAGDPYARRLTSTWDSKPKKVIVEIARNLVLENRVKGWPKLEMPKRLDETSMPVLADGTRLVAHETGYKDSRKYARVDCTTRTGKIRIREHETVLVSSEFVGQGFTKCVYRKGKLRGGSQFATFQPSSRPDPYDPAANESGDFWYLETKEGICGTRWWSLDETLDDDEVVEWTAGYSAMD